MNQDSKTHRRPVTPALAFLAMLGLLGGCASPTTVADLMPEASTSRVAAPKMPGSIAVRTSVPTGTTSPTYKTMEVSEWIDSQKLKQAIEQSIARDSMFSEVRQGNADYLLEVWIDKIQNVLDIAGEGFVFNFTSVWRLTRLQDGNVVVCEFVKGHGAARAMAARAYPPGISAATRTMIEKGLVAISDQSQSYLSAQSTAGTRPTIAAAQ